MENEVLKFWFEEIEPSQWWVKDLAFDQEIEKRFSLVHKAANRGELFGWRESAKGRLAEILVLDQFSRNIFRDKPQSFASDSLALVLAQEAISSDADKELTPTERAFLYMPFLHSESLLIHEEAVKLYEANGIENNLTFEVKHKVIIERFGRYPHRNSTTCI